MRESPTSTHRSRRARAGFSLIELMTVVLIAGILAAIAIPTMGGYIYKSRTSEATQFLGTIRLRQEAFRSEFGQYCNTAQGSTGTCLTPATDLSGFGTGTNFVPSQSNFTGLNGFNYGPLGKELRGWVPTTSWSELGARPSSDVRFSYAVAAGQPATAVGLGVGWTAATADFWWVARAVGDLDGDGTQVTFETYSANSAVWVGTGTTALEKGWE